LKEMRKGNSCRKAQEQDTQEFNKRIHHRI
jgi:hypothetical protein